jgi:hypothetical protein
VGEYYDKAVSGADRIDERLGFREMLQKLAANGAKTIIVESPDRFARDLAVQLAGHDMLKELGISIIPASAPDFFTEDTPTVVLVRQVLGAIAQFDKARTVAKLAAARKRTRESDGRCEGRSLLVRPGPRWLLSLTGCADAAPKVGNYPCVALRMNSSAWLSQRAWQALCCQVCSKHVVTTWQLVAGASAQASSADSPCARLSLDLAV